MTETKTSGLPPRKIAIEDIKIDLRFQVRHGVDEEKVEDYSERMKEGDPFPPVILFRHEGDYYLTDRIAAAKRIDRGELEAFVCDSRLAPRSMRTRLRLSGLPWRSPGEVPDV
jgi:hypothetical protein